MITHTLSTATLLAALGIEADRDRQMAVIEEIRRRPDLFNIEPLLVVGVDERHHHMVRRAAIECAALRNSAQALGWLRGTLDNPRAPVGSRSLAIQGLAALQLPHVTLPILEQVGAGVGPRDLRIDAIRMIVRFKNLRSVSTLLGIAQGRDRVVADAARAALDDLIEANGGRRAAVDKMLERAASLRQQGKTRGAAAVLQAASQLDPYNGRVLYQVARLSVA